MARNTRWVGTHVAAVTPKAAYSAAKAGKEVATIQPAMIGIAINCDMIIVVLVPKRSINFPTGHWVRVQARAIRLDMTPSWKVVKP